MEVMSIYQLQRKVGKKLFTLLPVQVKWYDKVVGYIVSPADFKKIHIFEEEKKANKNVYEYTPDMGDLQCQRCGKLLELGDSFDSGSGLVLHVSCPI